MSYALDLVTDLSDELGSDPNDYPELTKREYTSSSRAANARRYQDNSDGDTRCSFASLVFNVNTFFGREIVTRCKAIAETFAQIGGAWSSSMLIIMIFFKSTVIPVVLGQPVKIAKMVRWHKKLPETDNKSAPPDAAHRGWISS